MNKKDIWRYKSLEQLENKSWGPATAEDSGIVQKCLALVKVPVVKLSASELRVLIGQSFNPTYLVPLALEFLQHDVLVTAGMYPGDLLKNVLDVPVQFWEEHPDLHTNLSNIMRERSEEIEAELDLPEFWRRKAEA
ncbi:contact-dependent growth inhibition system immunity protein [Chitinophaga sp. 30R24]|uniref:contact-dependent growth inhibition system immunity protein n=1 Tax=Chitinophaga sp. 30R24 TaxID=3248838 RepID=UPI003B8F9FD3